jgi:hypothetical protein
MFKDMKPVYFNHSPVGRKDNGILKMEMVSKEVEMIVK